MKYLYGASIKKIQSYIFDSSRLKEIAGASELVEFICTDFFRNFISEEYRSRVHSIIQAAGNIRVIIDGEDAAAYVMRYFPKAVEETAPGIQIVHAVTLLAGEMVTADDSARLEDELKKQLPDPAISNDWSCTVKSRRTGKVVADFSEMDDAETVAKKAAVNKHWRKLRELFNVKEFPDDIDKIAGKDSFVAVIHADGNSLGKTLMNLRGKSNYGDLWTEFSRQLDEATSAAAEKSYREIFSGNNNRFRPIILGGDDLTVICAAEEAVPFTIKYLNYFEEEAAKREVLGKLTACAGIAFIKKNYPFYYGADLAEMLCTEAKKRAKACSENPVPGSFMFAKELGGYVDQSFSEMEERSLSAYPASDKKISFAFGPYVAGLSGNGKLPDASDLIKCAECLRDVPSLHSGLRRYISELHISEDAAKFLAERMEAIVCEKGKADIMGEFRSHLTKLTGDNSAATLAECLVCKKNMHSPALDILTVWQFLHDKKEENSND